MKYWSSKIAALVALACVATATPAEPLATTSVIGEGNAYTFREPPVNAMGVKSIADLRGKPVLIDFWGTR